LEKSKRHKVSLRIFDSYNRWLEIIGDNDKRRALEKMSHLEAGRDKTFQEIRTLGSEFAKGLKLLFFNRDSDTDPIANLSLEYAAF
jgi:hypothetical protein